MKRLNRLLFGYLAKEFLIKFLGCLCILLSVVFLFETIELIRRASGKADVGIIELSGMALYKLPDVGQQILPFITLFAAITTYYSLSQRQELVSIRSAGLSVWQFLTPVITMSFILGLFYIAILHPLSAAAMSRYEALSDLYFGNGSKKIEITTEGIWLKQNNMNENGHFILTGRDLNAKDWSVKKVSVFFFDEYHTHTHRVDAKKAILKPGEWHFQNISIHNQEASARTLPLLRIPTALTAETIAESFSNHLTISFWRLPSFIRSLDETGLDTTNIKTYYQFLLCLPLSLVAMALMAAAVSLRTGRENNSLLVVVAALGFGFASFFLSGFLKALSLGHKIPIIMGIWAPSILIILIAMMVLIKLEDG